MVLGDFWTTQNIKWVIDIGCFKTPTFFYRNTALGVNCSGTREVRNPNPCIYDLQITNSGDKLKQARLSAAILPSRALTAFLSAVISREGTGARVSIISEVLSSLLGQSKPKLGTLLPVCQLSDLKAHRLSPNGVTGKQSSKTLADKSGWRQARTRTKQKLQIKWRSSQPS